MTQALTIDVEARFAQVLDGLDQLNAKSSKTVQSMESAFSGLKATVAGLAAAFTVDALAQRFARAVESMDALDDAAQKTGVSVEALSSIFNTLAPTGVNLEQITDATTKLVKAMQGADEEAKGAGAAFAAIGVTARDSSGNLRSADQVLQEVATALNKYEDGANKVAIAQALFGKSGAELLPILKDLAEKQRSQATVTAEQAAAAAQLKEDWARLGLQGEQLGQSIASSVIPWLSKMLDQLAAGKEAAGGLFGALGRYGLTNPLKGPLDQIADAQARIAKINQSISRDQARLDTGRMVGGAKDALEQSIAGSRADIAQLERDIAYYTKLAKMAGEIDTANEMTGAAKGKPTAPALPGGESKDKKPKRTTYDQAPLTDDQRGIIEAFKQIEGVQQRAAQAATTLETLDQLFFQGSLTAQQYDDIVRALFKTTETAGQDGAGEVAKLASRWQDLIEPARQYRRELAEINRLEDAGALAAEEAVKARTMVFQKLDALNATSTEKVKEQRDEVERLGLQFISSFENAAVSGGNLRNVVQGLAQDIAKMLIRQNVTLPILNAITDALKPTPATGWTNGYDLGGKSLENRSMVMKDLATTSTVANAAPTIVINQSIDSRTDAATVAAMMDQSTRRAVGTVFDMQRRGQWQS